jgi:5,10-methylene-tetrahydrofolate dehydrogenase/methenyl tetrahydrofolate cyclohydrolase
MPENYGWRFNRISSRNSTGMMEILRFYEIPMKGKEAVVIGRSMVVGKPNAMLF